ncbi:MAG: carbohydrate ABC transporter permease, partial [Caldicoprobacter sp.]|uniref:carbohydrate ABC transporter permease n=1 Tax=Caldicoprobacter sp. TaxID=2004500 RepID=UPI0039C0C71B
LMSLVIFGVPMYFVLINSFKTSAEAAELSISWPKTFQIIENYKTVLTAEKGVVMLAFYNSTIITVLSVALLIIVCSMAGFVLNRRTSRASNFINFLILSGLMLPPAIVPTIWILNAIGLFKTLIGLVLVEVALSFSFSTLLYKSFMVSIPREIDESAIIDGCNGFRLFFQIIFPLLKPVTSTIIVLSSVNIFNDFVNPLYFLPGARNVTVQLALYNFMGRYLTTWNLLFATVVLISIPPLILFIFFNKKIIAGMTAGAIKA